MKEFKPIFKYTFIVRVVICTSLIVSKVGVT